MDFSEYPFTKVPNFLIEFIYSNGKSFSKLEISLLMYIIRNSVGYGKNYHDTSTTHIAKMMNERQPNISTALTSLEKKSIIIKQKGKGRFPLRLAFNANSDEWLKGDNEATKPEPTTQIDKYAKFRFTYGTHQNVKLHPAELDDITDTVRKEIDYDEWECEKKYNGVPFTITDFIIAAGYIERASEYFSTIENPPAPMRQAEFIKRIIKEDAENEKMLAEKYIVTAEVDGLADDIEEEWNSSVH